ncbi:MAG TPA: fatty acid desaturase [Candidatus Limnocylindrales bacterium]|nr:fatty acid desaturase [Candidatus Limnocylindrales bacterium]
MVFPLEISDLCHTSPWRRRVALARPLVGVALFAVTVHIGWWWLTPLVMFAIFVAVVNVTHDAVHRVLGLGPRGTDWALCFMGLVLLESGHAYRITHLQHHRRFPHPTDDPEGYPAGMTVLGAVFYGPVFLIRLWWWAWRTGRDRAWLAVEACVPILVLAMGLLSFASFPGILVYVTMAIVGSWVYPLLTVYLPHHDYGDTPLSQARTLRGRILPAILLELTYHLEHHLYPQVPSHNLPELGRRLDPYFAASGVQPVRVP